MNNSILPIVFYPFTMASAIVFSCNLSFSAMSDCSRPIPHQPRNNKHHVEWLDADLASAQWSSDMVGKRDAQPENALHHLKVLKKKVLSLTHHKD
jgi:hypothetical protein